MTQCSYHLRLYLCHVKTWSGPDYFYCAICKSLDLKKGCFSFLNDNKLYDFIYEKKRDDERTSCVFSQHHQNDFQQQSQKVTCVVLSI